MIVCCRKSAFLEDVARKGGINIAKIKIPVSPKNHICYAWQVFNREGVPIGHIESSLETLVEFFN